MHWVETASATCTCSYGDGPNSADRTEAVGSRPFPRVILRPLFDGQTRAALRVARDASRDAGWRSRATRGAGLAKAAWHQSTLAARARNSSSATTILASSRDHLPLRFRWLELPRGQSIQFGAQGTNRSPKLVAFDCLLCLCWVHGSQSFLTGLAFPECRIRVVSFEECLARRTSGGRPLRSLTLAVPAGQPLRPPRANQEDDRAANQSRTPGDGFATPSQFSACKPS